jgi:hypothetical protein
MQIPCTYFLIYDRTFYVLHWKRNGLLFGVPLCIIEYRTSVEFGFHKQTFRIWAPSVRTILISLKISPMQYYLGIWSKEAHEI